MVKIQHKDTNFRFIGYTPNFKELRDDVLQLTKEDWSRFKYRQQNIVGHRDTMTVPLIFDYRGLSGHIEHRQYERFVPHLDAIARYLADNGEPQSMLRSNLVLLKAQCSIGRHIDKGEFLQSSRRVHIPIVSNRDCIFEVDGELLHLPEGQMWEVNNTGKYHSVANGGLTDRIHLIIDIA